MSIDRVIPIGCMLGILANLSCDVFFELGYRACNPCRIRKTRREGRAVAKLRGFHLSSRRRELQRVPHRRHRFSIAHIISNHVIFVKRAVLFKTRRGQKNILTIYREFYRISYRDCRCPITVQSLFFYPVVDKPFGALLKRAHFL